MQELTKNAAQDIAQKYLEEGADPTEQMAKTAQEHELTAQQIQPIARRANRKILVKLQKRGVQEGGDPHATFPKIEPDQVVMMIRQEGGEMPDEPTPTAPEPSHDSGVLDQIFGTGEEDATCQTMGYELDDYMDEPEAIPNKEMALRVMNKAEEMVSQKKRKLNQVEMKLEEALHRLQKQATQYLRAGQPIEPLEDIPHVSETIKEARQNVASVQHIDGPYALQDDHSFVKLAEQIHSLRQEHDEAEYAWKLAKDQSQDYRQAIKEEGWIR